MQPLKKETSHISIRQGKVSSWMFSIDWMVWTITRLGGYILLFSILAGCIRYYHPFPAILSVSVIGIYRNYYRSFYYRIFRIAGYNTYPYIGFCHIIRWTMYSCTDPKYPSPWSQPAALYYFEMCQCSSYINHSLLSDITKIWLKCSLSAANRSACNSNKFSQHERILQAGFSACGGGAPATWFLSDAVRSCPEFIMS